MIDDLLKCCYNFARICWVLDLRSHICRVARLCYKLHTLMLLSGVCDRDLEEFVDVLSSEEESSDVAFEDSSEESSVESVSLSSSI